MRYLLFKLFRDFVFRRNGWSSRKYSAFLRWLMPADVTVLYDSVRGIYVMREYGISYDPLRDIYNIRGLSFSGGCIEMLKADIGHRFEIVGILDDPSGKITLVRRLDSEPICLN